MKYLIVLTACFAISISSCDKDKIAQEPSNSFMPLQIGNYWGMNNENFSEVRDTVRINGDLYYEIFSRVGGDVEGVSYLRLDENQDLISSDPSHPALKYIQAKFNAKVGDTFQTLGDQTVNDYQVTVVEKTDTKMTFSFDMIYHPNLKGHPHTVTYIKGIGWADDFKSIRINGRTIK